MVGATVTASVAAVLPLIFFLLTLPILASDAGNLRHLLFSAGLPRPHAALSSATDPCLISGISCELMGSSFRATRISLPSLRLAGSISTHVGLLSDLRELSLPNNRISGPLPVELSLCTNLEILNLRNNRISGEIPLDFSSLSSLRSLDLSSNRLYGDLRFLVYFPKLENLSLARNLFSGEIPHSLSSFPNLLTVDLSGNPYLSGNHPLTPHRRSLLPSNILAPAPSPYHNSIASAPGISPISSPIPANDHHRGHKHKILTWILGFFIGSISGILGGLVVSMIYHLILNYIRGRRRKSGTEIFSPIIKNKEDISFLEKETGLTDLQIIGRGGSGEVYLKELPTTNGVKKIAIKRIRKAAVENGPETLSEEESRLLDKWMRQIRSEIRTVGRIRHRNLLPLLAHVSRPDCHYLIYEYMTNGSLHNALRDAANGLRDLSWSVRHRIAMGIAAGLEHLHHHHKPHIFHRDLKPANVLLDENMEAIISDFGFAKEVPENNTHITMSNIAGTVGYIAPEYYQTMKYTSKCDIYSFGVILAVMVIGKLPSDEFFVEREELGLVKWMRNQVRMGNTAACFDEQIAGRGDDEKLELALRVACFCTANDPKERPSSKDVRAMLAQISLG
ncbi:leucine-rich repeat receptor-like serine/threonine/tyrosine-protein kinase SOBIR1 [Phalaenopsis equestris]|uniref:leucine-rich repeat receptor-like serine/threonine/tyrosine-protein kinase SOBIR1 n=1 Tax=Phalaenopsis equestris TaxID=78828 RepID=UPI0009E1BD88|nr:leucine-rich repeat receptor-like serine/threonine/tyrosine-protein kinase SOBIR1 [Phalaenopsis equestris]